MTDTPAGSRYCCGTTVTDHPGDRRLVARMLARLNGGDYAASGFVVCRCAGPWRCEDPDSIPRGDGRYPQNEIVW